MGLEAECRARHQGVESAGKARLEDKDLFFRGDFSLKVPLKEIRKVEAVRGELRVEWPQGPTAFLLGSARAEKWYLKIRYPRNLLDKLGVKPNQRVVVLNLEDAEFQKMLEDRTSDIGRDGKSGDADFVFFKLESVEELAQLPRLRERIKKNGSIWALWPKGRPQLKENDIRRAALDCGLVDVKVVSFSKVLSGLKLMIPVKLR